MSLTTTILLIITILYYAFLFYANSRHKKIQLNLSNSTEVFGSISIVNEPVDTSLVISPLENQKVEVAKTQKENEPPENQKVEVAETQEENEPPENQKMEVAETQKENEPPENQKVEVAETQEENEPPKNQKVEVEAEEDLELGEVLSSANELADNIDSIITDSSGNISSDEIIEVLTELPEELIIKEVELDHIIKEVKNRRISRGKVSAQIAAKDFSFVEVEDLKKQVA